MFSRVMTRATRYAGSLTPAPQPDLERQQRPQRQAEIGAPGVVALDERVHVVGGQIGAVVRVRRQQMIVQRVAKRAAEPEAERDAEAHLAAPLNLGRDQIVERLAEDDLGAATRELHRVG